MVYDAAMQLVTVVPAVPISVDMRRQPNSERSREATIHLDLLAAN